MELREQALAALAGGMSRGEVCQAFGCHRTTLNRWKARAARGELASRYHGGNPRKIGPEQEAALLGQLEAAPDATLQEHVARWQEEQGVLLSSSSMERAVGRLGWSRKKRA